MQVAITKAASITLWSGDQHLPGAVLQNRVNSTEPDSGIPFRVLPYRPRGAGSISRLSSRAPTPRTSTATTG